MKKIFILIILLIIIHSTSAFLEISEINYNPEGSDNNKEFIEIYTDLNLSNFKIKDLTSEDILIQIQYFPSNYSLIVEEDFNYSNINATIYSAGTTIGNNLNNDEDLIIIENQSIILDAIHYYSAWGGNNNGKTICKINNLWKECIPSPGSENAEVQTTLELNIEINEFLPDPEGYDNAPMPEGEWIELFNKGNQEVDLTGFKLRDKSNHEIIISDTTSNNQIISPNDYLVIYTNGFSGFLNNEGLEKIYFLSPENSEIDKVSYSDSREGTSWSKINNNWELTIPTPNEKNPDNPNKKKESKIEIKKLPEEINFGETIQIDLEIYKGDETKESIQAYIWDKKNKISKITKFKIKNKYSENKLTIPIQLNPNCNLKEKEGIYTLKVEGLGEDDEKTIKLKGTTKELCKEIKIKEKDVRTPIKTTEFETVINDLNFSNTETVYESKSRKSIKYGPYFLLLTLTLLITQMVIEKWKK